MSAMRSGGGPDDADAGSWATESLPMSVRKELLERELSRLGFGRAAAQAGTSTREHDASQQQADSGSSHPQADGEGGDAHGS